MSIRTRNFFCLISAVIFVNCFVPANAELEERLGGLAWYDPIQNLTWYTEKGVTNEWESWYAKSEWVADLVVAGKSQWRLPLIDKNGDGVIMRECWGPDYKGGVPECLDNELAILKWDHGYHGPSFSRLYFGTSVWTGNEGPEDKDKAFRWTFRTGAYKAVPKYYSGQWGAGIIAVHDGDIDPPECQTDCSAVDLSIVPGSFEIAQAVFDPDINKADARIDLVLGKKGAAFAEAEIAPPPTTPVVADTLLRVVTEGGTKEEPGDPVTFLPTLTRQEVIIPFAPSIVGPHTLEIIIDPDSAILPNGSIEETIESNNSAVATANVWDVERLNLSYVPANPVKIGDAECEVFGVDRGQVELTNVTAEKYMRGMFPLGANDLDVYISDETFDLTNESSLLGFSAIFTDALTLHSRALREGADKIVGVVGNSYFNCHGFFTAGADGVAYGGEGLRSVIVTSTSSEAVLHELGHAIGLVGESYITNPINDIPPYFYTGDPVRGYWAEEEKMFEGPETEGIMSAGRDLNQNTLWIQDETYAEILLGLLTPLQDPELMTIAGIIDKNGGVELLPSYRLPLGDQSPNESGEYALQIYDSAGLLKHETTFSLNFTARIHPFEEVALEIAPIALEIPYPGSTDRIIIRKGGIILSEFSPGEKLLSDAISSIPDDAFFKNPTQRRKVLLNKVRATQEMIDNGDLMEAREKLTNDLRKHVVSWISSSFVKSDPLEIDKIEALELIDRIISDL